LRTDKKGYKIYVIDILDSIFYVPSNDLNSTSIKVFEGNDSLFYLQKLYFKWLINKHRYYFDIYDSKFCLYNRLYLIIS